jgi:K319-like protein
MAYVLTTILLFLPSILLSGLITDINSPESSLNTSKVMEPVLAQETPSGNATNSEAIADAGPDQTVKSGDQVQLDGKEPIADAGPDQTVKSGDQVQLDGTQSYDPDCENGNDKWCTKGLTYSWESAGNNVLGSDIPERKVTFTAPSVHETTELTFELYVEDDSNNWTKDSVTITVEPGIEDGGEPRPVANAGQDQRVEAGQGVHLDGTLSRPEGALKSSEWKQTGGPHVELSDADTLQPTFSAPSVEKSKKLTFELVVYGAAGPSKPDIVTVRLEPIGEDGGQPVRYQPSHESDITFNATFSKIKDLVSDLKQNELSRFLPFAGLAVGAGALAYGINRSKKSKHKGSNVAVITRGGIE